MPFYAIAMLAVGTFMFRLIGPALSDKVTIPARLQVLLSDSSVVLLVSLAVTSAFIDGHSFAGWARVVGVSVGACLSILKFPFPVVVIGAGAVAAALRYSGLG